MLRATSRISQPPVTVFVPIDTVPLYWLLPEPVAAAVCSELHSLSTVPVFASISCSTCRVSAAPFSSALLTWYARV